MTSPKAYPDHDAQGPWIAGNSFPRRYRLHTKSFRPHLF